MVGQEQDEGREFSCRECPCWLQARRVQQSPFDLPKGQVTAQGLFALPPRNAPFAITGGTGAYRDAGGQGTVTETSPTTARIVLHILHLK